MIGQLEKELEEGDVTWDLPPAEPQKKQKAGRAKKEGSTTGGR